MANIAVIGTGYVGLTTGAYLAHLGHHVVCADVVPEKIAALAVFLCGEAASTITGAALSIDGGWVAQ